ncbi:unnamed protein product [Euphydryas editha]|uniref:Uncharacterized protein n=1 Tax=Euphydryas editha TaxID=104508 RepID=A0AAU9VE20_EUPED|nr:unnamed protein product [Euphydryas editha]
MNLLRLGVRRRWRRGLVVPVRMRVPIRIGVEAAARRYLAGECVQRVQHGGRRPLGSERPGHGEASPTFASPLSTAGLSSDKRGGTPSPRVIAT